ncbi:MAG TPA: cell division protein ZapE [Alphaproteobacteria bacterium]|nr:cell division protein ZapE [Alphaproteobacteria bacterium]
MTEGPLAVYRALVRDGAVKPDPMQELAAEKLESLHHALRHYQPSSGASGWRVRLGLARRPDPAPQGLYLYGGVGRGKSMLMDLFFRSAPVEAKRRVHFHQFMLEVHDRLHEWRRSVASAFDKKRGRHMADPIPPLAAELAEEAWLLCFDEFHVVDIADAMILGRLFTALFDAGVVVVATSNWAPDDLYKDGLNRQNFLPFIGLLKEKLDVLHLAGGIDYRLARIKGMRVYHEPLGPQARGALEEAFADLTDGAAAAPTSLPLKGRTLEVPKAARGVAWLNFADLCERPLGAADYLALAGAFHTVLIEGVPVMDETRRNEAKRFMTLVDALYEHKVNAVVSADGPPDRIYVGETGAVEFQRTVSRLMEMQAADYLMAPHRPGEEPP